jgi:serine/threonine protein kinase
MPQDPSALGSRRSVRIGKYEVLAHIATGGMGAVYRATDTETGQEVALKVLTTEMAAKPAMLERFKREGRNAAKLRHENIVTIYEFDEVQGNYYIAMEFVDGIDLHDYIEQKGQLDPEETRQIMIQAARALAHAHVQGIVHRDIKPSNFLLTRKGNRLVVKLTDMGLARELHSEEFRVTRAGTTVGTVDYIAPEQARDSSNADTRSDMYSLGCTWFHMLTGQTPFCKGGLAERLIKHMEEPPPDVRTFNPKVSDALVAVLNKLLAKKPQDRYQEPRELVQALLEMNAVRNPAQQDEPVSPSRSRGDLSRTSRRGPTKRASSGSKSRAEPRKTAGTKPLAWVAAIAAVLLLVGSGIAFIIHARNRPHTDLGPLNTYPGNTNFNLPGNFNNGNTNIGNPKDVGTRDSRPPDPPKDGTKNPNPNPDPPKKPKYPALYAPRLPIPVERLRQELDATAGGFAVVPQDAPVIRVGRLANGAGATFSSLAAACQAVPAGKLTVIEVHDNGPLYETAVPLSDRQVVLRAGKGYRPLIVWDAAQAAEERKKAGGPMDAPLALFTARGGSLQAEGLAFAVQWPASVLPRADALFRIQDGDLQLRDCTVSIAGKHPEGIRLVRLSSDGTRGADTTPLAHRLRFVRCYARGTPLVGLDLDAPDAQVTIEQCLWAGGPAPLIQCHVGPSHPPTVRVAQSTLLCSRTLLRLSVGEKEVSAAFKWIGWDALLARSGAESDGDLLVLPAETNTRGITWDAWNCLYTGWTMLVTGGVSRIAASDLDSWKRAWTRLDGDVTQSQPWPRPAYTEIEEKPAADYRTLDTPVGFACSYSTDLPVGCHLEGLPAPREGWLGLTFDRVSATVTTPLEFGPPEVPTSTDGAWYGGKVDLNQKPTIDLGLFLAQKLSGPVGRKIVLLLSGTGEKTTSPIRLPRGVSLTLYAEPPEADAAPLVLRFVTPREGRPEALIEVDGGNLDLQNVELRFPESITAAQPPHLVRITGGNLRVSRCRLQTPVTAPAGLRSLILFQGSGLEDPQQAFACVLSDSYLVSAQTAVHGKGLGVRLAVQNCAVVAGQHAFQLDPGSFLDARDKSPRRSGVQVTLDHATVAARGTVFELEDLGATELPAEPILVQTRECAFLNPFVKPSKAGVFQLRGPALSRGQLLWQSDDDAFDARLHYGLASASAIPDQIQPASQWLRWLGSPAVRRPFLDVAVRGNFDIKTWASDQLALQRLPGAGDRRPGADLAALGMLKKPK